MSNIWSQFAKLTAQAPAKVVKVIAHEGDESVVEDRSGQTTRVPGITYAVGTFALMRDQRLTAAAADLTDGGIHYV